MPSYPTARRWPRLCAAASALLAIVAAAGGCGGSSGSGEADPVGLVPASAPLVANVALKPAGGSGAAVAVAARKLTHLAEPYASLAQTLLASPGAKLEYKRDLSPWIGERAAIFLTSLDIGRLSRGAASPQSLLQGGLAGLSSVLGVGALSAEGAQGAIVLSTSDAGAARSFLDKQAAALGARASSYRGVSLHVAPGGLAEGMVEDFAAIGSEAALHAVIDTSLGGSSYATSGGYAKPSSDTIASVYAKPETLSTAAGADAGAQVSSLAGQLLDGVQSASLTVTASDSAIALQGEAHTTGAVKPLFGGEGARALGELPATAWLAAGVGDTGANLPRALGLLRGVASLGSSTVFANFGGPSIERVFKVLSAPGANLQRDFGAWAGPGAMFVGGSSLFNLQAALVIASKDPAASQAAVAKLAALMRRAGAVVAGASIPGTDAAQSVKLQDFPAVIFIADGSGKFVLGLGQQSVEAALSPSATLSTSAAYSSAAATLGGGIEPSLIVEFPTLLGFLEGIGLTQSPGVSSLVPYLRSLGTLTAGASSQDGVSRYKAVLGLS